MARFTTALLVVSAMICAAVASPMPAENVEKRAFGRVSAGASPHPTYEQLFTFVPFV